MYDIQCPKCMEHGCSGEAPKEKRPYFLACQCDECEFEFCYDTCSEIYYTMDGDVIDNKLTVEALKKMAPGMMFADGSYKDHPSDINMTASGNWLRWVAVRGGMHDWAIYIHFSSSRHPKEWVKVHGDKVCNENHIKKLVPCTDEAFKLYRY